MFVLIEQIKGIINSLNKEGMTKEANGVQWLLEAYELELHNQCVYKEVVKKIMNRLKSRRPQTVIIERIQNIIAKARNQLK